MERKFNVSNRKPIARVKSSRRRPGCVRLFVCPTTGGRLEISVSPRETVLGVKAALARKLRILPGKITLIYKDKVLKEGCIQDYQIPDDSHVTLLPNMESGLTVHHTEKSIMQALENLTETQVSDFLSGKSPLVLAIHMGENMVFVQLQLSMFQGQTAHAPSPTTPTTAAVLSQTGLSPSTLAEASRCLSQRLQRLQEMGVSSCFRATTAASPSHVCPLPETSHSPSHVCQLPVTSHSPSHVCPLPVTSHSPVGTSHPAQPPCSSTDSSPSSSLFQESPNPAAPASPHSPGAVIKSMKHLGHGVYTGTFQGTLDPALQDGTGQPRRSVSTILHILNDLLVAAPKGPASGQGQGQTLLRPVQVPGKTAAASLQLPSLPLLTPSLPLTLPASPTFKKSAAAVNGTADSIENSLLRDKMQRVQMMLAQRKEQRRTRRETTAPYMNQRSSRKPVATNMSTSMPSTLLPSLCMSATAAATEGTDPATHSDKTSDSANSYCLPSIEQDSLAV